MTSTQGTLLVASDNSADAQLVKSLLHDEFSVVHTSTHAQHAIEDCEKHLPDVLILALDTLAKAKRYYSHVLQGRKMQDHRHRTVILCGKNEVEQVARLCIQQSFNDYVLFWPMNHDAPRLCVAVHQALRQREMRADEMVSAADTPPPIVLVVDDDEFQRKMVAKILAPQNYRLMFAADGLQALELVHDTCPDLVLLDVQMPEMDGVEVARRLKVVPRFAHVPIIMITGNSAGEVVRDSMNVGAIDFVVKPFDRHTLIAKVARGLSKEHAAGH